MFKLFTSAVKSTLRSPWFWSPASVFLGYEMTKHIYTLNEEKRQLEANIFKKLDVNRATKININDRLLSSYFTVQASTERQRLYQLMKQSEFGPRKNLGHEASLY